MNEKQSGKSADKFCAAGKELHKHPNICWLLHNIFELINFFIYNYFKLHFNSLNLPLCGHQLFAE